MFNIIIGIILSLVAYHVSNSMLNNTKNKLTKVT